MAAATQAFGRTTHPRHGEVWAYEVDGFGNALMMDDPGQPGLLNLPFLGCCPASDALYLRTRGYSLSDDNPYFVRGSAGEGLSSPHAGRDFIWPMAIVSRALTSTDDREIAASLHILRNTNAGTHFMHESFYKDDATRYTRPWFAWANGLFGELILNLHRDRPHLLRRSYA